MVLGLQWPCTREEVHKAYREGAKKHHPDRGGEEQQFKQVQEAYDRIQQYFDQAGIQ
jgi:curved DNA-binding protein CbpA